MCRVSKVPSLSRLLVRNYWSLQNTIYPRQGAGTAEDRQGSFFGHLDEHLDEAPIFWFGVAL